jgi:hypothetical protein
VRREVTEFGFRQMSPDDVDWRHRDGETPEERNARMRIEPITKQVEEFGIRLFNSVASPEEADALLTPMMELVALLESRDDTTLPGGLRDSVIAGLAGACKQITKTQSLDCETDLGRLVKKVLLLAASNRYLEPDPEGSEESASGQTGGWPVARVVAAEGLLALAAGSGCTDPTILETLEQLFRDPSAKVRYPIARYALWLHKAHPATMWEWLETFSKDKNIAIREGCVHAKDYLANLNADRALKLVDKVLAGAPKEGKGAEELIRYSVQALTAWCVERNESAARGA